MTVCRVCQDKVRYMYKEWQNERCPAQLAVMVHSTSSSYQRTHTDHLAAAGTGQAMRSSR